MDFLKEAVVKNTEHFIVLFFKGSHTTIQLCRYHHLCDMIRYNDTYIIGLKKSVVTHFLKKKAENCAVIRELSVVD